MDRSCFSPYGPRQVTAFRTMCGAGLIVALMPAVAYARDGNGVVLDGAPHAVQDTAGKAPILTASSLRDVQVIKVRRLNRKVSVDTAGPRSDDLAPLPKDSIVQAGMDDIIVLVVRNLRTLWDNAECKNTRGQDGSVCKPQKILLYLDGRAIKGLEPESGAPILGDTIGTLQFHLERTAQSDEAWSDLLGAPPLDKSQFFNRPTLVSVGLEDGFPVNSDPVYGHFSLIRIHRRWLIAALLASVGILIGFLRYARHSDLLRDLGPSPRAEPDPTNPARRLGRLKPYSLGRCQMAWWFFLVVGSFFIIFLITRSYETITSTALALIGISAGTFLGSAAIDADKIAGDKSEIADLTARKLALETELQDLQQQFATANASADLLTIRANNALKAGQLETVNRQLVDAQDSRGADASQGFLQDLLADPQGQSFHRFQMLVWTLVLTVLFVVSVYRRLAMPEFSATLLGLLGISNGLYLGFKFPERQQPRAPNT